MRPEHWLYTIPLRLRSLFRWGQADQESATFATTCDWPRTCPTNSLMRCWLCQRCKLVCGSSFETGGSRGSIWGVSAWNANRRACF